MTDDLSRRSTPAERGLDELFRAVVDYGKLSMQILVVVTGSSAIAMLAMLSFLLSGRFVVSGPPYADIPAALIAMGAATSLVALAAATAYFAQYACFSHSAGEDGLYINPYRLAMTDRFRWRSVAEIFQLMTFALMGLAYIAFAIGGGIVIHFCFATMTAIAHLGASHL